MTKNRCAEAKEGVGVTAGGPKSGGRGRGGGAKDRPAACVAVMPLWQRPRGEGRR
jgi:hypothetical protein